MLLPKGMTSEMWEELLELRRKADERESVQALRERIIAAVRQADEATVRKIAELLGYEG